MHQQDKLLVGKHVKQKAYVRNWQNNYLQFLSERHMTVAPDICISCPYFEEFNKAAYHTHATMLFLKKRMPIK